MGRHKQGIINHKVPWELRRTSLTITTQKRTWGTLLTENTAQWKVALEKSQMDLVHFHVLYFLWF